MDILEEFREFDDTSDCEFGDLFQSASPLYEDRVCGFDWDADCKMASDCLDIFLGDPILNDRMISDASSAQPLVQCEHSYSMSTHEQHVDIAKSARADSELEVIQMIDPNKMATSGSSELHDDAENDCAVNADSIKEEPLDPETTMVTVTRTTNPQTLLKPTILLTTHQMSSQPSIINVKQEHLLLPELTVSVKPEKPCSFLSSASSPTHSYEQSSLPPTPPSSSSSSSASDSEGCASPERSLPPSPARHTLYSRHTPQLTCRAASPVYSHCLPSSQPFFMQPIPSTGLLVLSEEEKRTLVTEGYPIPSKLPLTKTEEKNLKKIRRKIKNKISAQESRRKKKEYLESLERKMESFCQENVDLKKKVDDLENTNRSLMSQLHRLQAAVSKLRPTTSAPSASSCLMVLMLCFAIFIGPWSPMTSSQDASHGHVLPSADSSWKSQQQAPPDVALHDVRNMAEQHVPAQSVVADPYTTPTLKSRVLMSLPEEEPTQLVNDASFCLRDVMSRWSSLLGTKRHSTVEADVTSERNETHGGDAQALMHPDVAVMTRAPSVNATR